jgi:hypothetical protein
MGKVKCEIEYRDRDWAFVTVEIMLDEHVIEKGDEFSRNIAAIVIAGTKRGKGLNKISKLTVKS